MKKKASKSEKQASVPSQLYTHEYFTSDCEGYELYLNGVQELPERMQEALDMAGDLEGKRALDLGCGRGELMCEAALRGAQVVGMDYADAAIELSRERMNILDQPTRDRIELIKANAKELPFPSGCFDVVFMVDVYEHLYAHEMLSTLAEIKRVMRPDGKLIIHTGPNTWFYKYGYPLAREMRRLLLGKKLPPSLRGDYDHIMHVNEQSPLSLWRELKGASYKANVWPRTFLSGINPSPLERTLMKMLFARPAGYFFCISLLAVAEPREGGSEAQLRVGRVLRMMGPRSGDKALLIGESEGMLAARLADIPGVEVTWLEPSNEEPRGTHDEWSPAHGYSRLQGDPYRLPFPESEFDTIASQFTLDQLEQPSRAVSEWSRVLKKGGSLILVTSNRLFKGIEQSPSPKPFNTYDPAELANLTSKAGLEVAGVSTLIPDLKIPALYRGDYSFCLIFEKMPYFDKRGKLILLQAIKK
jgi:ubiquinone/menaquinone biosynthesis C-methylase UbiE